ncbi:MAG: type VI secretion system baseplate subunit TssE [Holosporaceae bacterium]|nr:type VI secretion system baseplate subunit TssE [Holosporaceae bacterium]
MTKSAIAPLFEKLVDENTEEIFEKTPKRLLNTKELQESIANDLSCLLNTKTSAIIKSSKITNPYFYGVKATAPTFAEDAFEIQKLESAIDEAIRQFEPRLSDAKSHVINIEGNSNKISIIIDAVVTIGNLTTPLSFPITMDT